MMTESEKKWVNEAIVKVVTHQYKKECPEAHELLKEWGYKVTKYDGSFEVKHPKTYKKVTATLYRWEQVIYLKEKSQRIYPKNFDKVDYVEYLRTPLNRDKYEFVYSKYRTARRNLRDAKWNVKYHQDALDDAQKEFDKKLAELKRHYEWNIKHHSERVVIEKSRVADIRKEFNLK